MTNLATQKFIDTYKREPEFEGFTPYRVCPLGAHSGHQLGRITGFAIDMPGKRYDIGNLESYRQVQAEYKSV